MHEPVIAIRSLKLDRGGRAVLDGLDLEVRAGEVHALLGGNGAGKSTTLAAILGFLKPGSGSIHVGGHCPSREPDEVRRAIAFLPENVALYEHLSAWENLSYFLSLAGETREPAAMEQALNAVQLHAQAWNTRAGGFSKGMRQKTAIALALLRRTPILLLDEPTTGLDPATTHEFNRLLGAQRDRGVAVLMVTHDLLGAAQVADRISMLRGGRVVREWTASPGPERFALAPLYQAFTGESAQ
jgi:ABC-2 type transport system ATP-binding protein